MNKIVRLTKFSLFLLINKTIHLFLNYRVLFKSPQHLPSCTLVLSGRRHRAILDPECPQATLFDELEVIEVGVVGRGDLDILVPPKNIETSVNLYF